MQASYTKKLFSKSVAAPDSSARSHFSPSPLKSLRDAQGLTQRQVAEYIGVTVQTISNIEREGYMPKLSALQFAKLCELFGLDIQQLAALWVSQQ